MELVIPCLEASRVLYNTKLVQRSVARLHKQNELSFWDALKLLQYSDVTRSRVQEEPEFVWDAGSTDFSTTLSTVMGLESVPDGWAYSFEEQKYHEQKIREGLGIFQSKFPLTYQAFCTLVPFLLIARRDGYGGGGVSNRVGIIWLSPYDSTTSVEHAENLLHEFIHQALFLEDMVNTVFPFNALVMDESSNQALSAVRRTKRGYDKSFHSAFVAYGIVEFYNKLGDFERVAHYLAPLLTCLDELIQHPNMLTENGQRQLNALVVASLKRHESISLEHVIKSSTL
jgi:hypothetical protein